MNTKRNHFVLSACAAILVKAYVECIAEYQKILPLYTRIHDDSPVTYEGLKAYAGAGLLSVTDAHSEHAIYGVAGNVTFRIFHDFGHLIYDCQFTCQDEVKLANIQWNDLVKHIPQEWLHVAKVVYFADTVEQSLYCETHGDFPVDQKAFVLDIMNKQLVLHFVV